MMTIGIISDLTRGVICTNNLIVSPVKRMEDIMEEGRYDWGWQISLRRGDIIEEERYDEEERGLEGGSEVTFMKCPLYIYRDNYGI